MFYANVMSGWGLGASESILVESKQASMLKGPAWSAGATLVEEQCLSNMAIHVVIQYVRPRRVGETKAVRLQQNLARNYKGAPTLSLTGLDLCRTDRGRANQSSSTAYLSWQVK